MEKLRTPVNGRFVLDSSLALAWCFEDERSDETYHVLEAFANGAVAVVPHLWAWEVNNTLILSERTKRLTPAQRIERISLLQRLLTEIDEAAHKETWSTAAMLAREHKLSLYDATYLEMSIRLNLPLGTLDAALRAAAKKVGVALLPANLPN
jgi:predicted nucleic acid-binding protein